ncbi:MAG: hypothetical protein U0271_37875 [Polyangiaceae bacterium]
MSRHPMTTLELRALGARALELLRRDEDYSHALDEEDEEFESDERDSRASAAAFTAEKRLALYALRFVAFELAARRELDAIVLIGSLLSSIDDNGTTWREIADRLSFGHDLFGSVAPLLTSEQVAKLTADPRWWVRYSLVQTLPLETQRGRDGLTDLAKDRSRTIRARARGRLAWSSPWWTELLPRDPEVCLDKETADWVQALLTSSDVKALLPTVADRVTSLPADLRAGLLASLIEEAVGGSLSELWFRLLLTTPHDASGDARWAPVELAAALLVKPGEGIVLSLLAPKDWELLSKDQQQAFCRAVVRHLPARVADLDRTCCYRVADVLEHWPIDADPTPVLELTLGAPLQGAALREPTDWGKRFGSSISRALARNTALEAHRDLLRAAYFDGRPGAWACLLASAFEGVVSERELEERAFEWIASGQRDRATEAVTLLSMSTNEEPEFRARLQASLLALYESPLRGIVLHRFCSSLLHLARPRLLTDPLEAWEMAIVLLTILSDSADSPRAHLRRRRRATRPPAPEPTDAEWTAFRAAERAAVEDGCVEHAVLLACPLPKGPLLEVDEARVRRGLRCAQATDSAGFSDLIDVLLLAGGERAEKLLVEAIQRDEDFITEAFSHAAHFQVVPRSVTNALRDSDQRRLKKWLAKTREPV